MEKKKIFFVITARPSYSRIRSVIESAKKNKYLKIYVVATASFLSNKFGSAYKYLEKDNLIIDYKLSTLFDDEFITGPSKSTGIQIIELSTLFYNKRPDAVVTIADRYECLATAISSSYMNIPLIHIQGGEISGNIDEKVRHAITKLSDYHLVSNIDAKKRVIKLGEENKRVFNVGCPSIDIAKKVKQNHRLMKSQNILKNFDGVGLSFDTSKLYKKYLVVLQHPVTTHANNSRKEFRETLMAVKELNIHVVWFWPNPDIGTSRASAEIRSFRERHKLNKIAFIKNISPDLFLHLLMGSMCLIGNSSVGIRECSFLRVPAVNIGDRQKNRLQGNNVINVNENKKEIMKAILSISNKKIIQKKIYGSGNSAEKIVSFLQNTNFKIKKQITY
ncbi:UDP-N-acetylglucosamine 2-epimerase [Alphaproteobacteria bacterium]|nr:UDP-N-acetylglucosamine 2-epimerase [Alphaproteobacteria bacterium]